MTVEPIVQSHIVTGLKAIFLTPPKTGVGKLDSDLRAKPYGYWSDSHYFFIKNSVGKLDKLEIFLNLAKQGGYRVLAVLINIVL